MSASLKGTLDKIVDASIQKAYGVTLTDTTTVTVTRTNPVQPGETLYYYVQNAVERYDGTWTVKLGNTTYTLLDSFLDTPLDTGLGESAYTCYDCSAVHEGQVPYTVWAYVQQPLEDTRQGDVGQTFEPPPSALRAGLANLFDPFHSYTYTPTGSGRSVSHPVGLIPELIVDSLNPPILGAVANAIYNRLPPPSVSTLAADVATFRGYVSAALAAVVQSIAGAVHATLTPSVWGGGTVLNAWREAALMLEAVTIGVGVWVNDDKWVPSVRVALISTRNQIADHITGTQTHPNYARDYAPPVRT